MTLGTATFRAALGAGLGTTASMLILVAGSAGADEVGWVPRDDTVTAVTGSRGSGFHVTYFGRPDAYLPTQSESVAECGEYHREVRRVRCRVEVRTWYRDPAGTRRAIRYARLDQH
jgi:hypothetical protein